MINITSNTIKTFAKQDTTALAAVLRLGLMVFFFGFIVNNKRCARWSPQAIILPVLCEALMINLSLRGMLPKALVLEL
jgi:hypothetical protein